MNIGSFSSSGSTYRCGSSSRNLGSVNHVGGKDYSQVLEVVRRNPGALRYESEELLDDADFILQAVTWSDRVLQYASNRLRSDRGFILEALNLNQHVLRGASEEVNGDREIVLKAVERNAGALQWASESLRGDRDVVLAAVKNWGGALRWASEALRGDRELVLEAVKTWEHALNNAGNVLRCDRDFILEVVQHNGHALRYAGKRVKGDRDVVLAAVRQNVHALEWASEELRGNREVVLEAVKHDALVFKFAANKLKQDSDFIMEAVYYNDMMLKYAGEELRGDREVMLKAVQHNERAFQFAANKLKQDSNFIMEAVRHNGMVFQYLSQELKGNLDVVLAAVRSDGLSLQYVSNRFKSNEAVVIAALCQNIGAKKLFDSHGKFSSLINFIERDCLGFERLSNELKNKKDVVLAAVRRNGLVLEHVPESLKNDRDVVLAAVNQNVEAWEFVPRTMSLGVYLDKLSQIFQNSADDGSGVESIIDIAEVKSIINDINNDYSESIYFNGSADALVQATDKIDLAEFEKPNDFDITVVVSRESEQGLSSWLIEYGFELKGLKNDAGFELYKKGMLEIKVVTEYQFSNLASFQNYTRVIKSGADYECKSEWPLDSLKLFKDKIMALTLHVELAPRKSGFNSNDNAAMRMIRDIIQKGFDWREDDLDNYAQYLKGFFKNKQHTRYFTDNKFNKNKFGNELNTFLKKHQSCLDKNLDGLNRVHRLMTKMQSHKDLNDHGDDIGKILSVIETAKNKITPREVGSLNQSTEGVSSSSSCSVPHHGQSWGQQFYYGQTPVNSQTVYSGFPARTAGYVYMPVGSYQSTWPANGGYLGMTVGPSPGPSPFFVPDPNQFFHR